MQTRINWIRLLTDHNIEFNDAGGSKGNVYCKCPFCGSSDPSQHMGINLTTGYWGCWRNGTHRGKSPVRLLMQLLGIPYGAARELAGLDEGYIDPDGYNEVATRLLKPVTHVAEENTVKVLSFNSEFEDIKVESLRARRFVDYLRIRGFHVSDIPKLVLQYKLKCSIRGDFQDRVIIPYFQDRALVTWTGRAINDSGIRYRDLSLSDSVIPAKHTLFNYNATQKKANILLVVEGPFDSLKLDFYGKKYNVRTVALSTNSITDEQTYILEEVCSNFNRVLVLMDNSGQLSIVDSFRMREKLSQIKNIGFTQVPFGKKDGGDLSRYEVQEFCRGISK